MEVLKVNIKVTYFSNDSVVNMLFYSYIITYREKFFFFFFVIFHEHSRFTGQQGKEGGG